MYEAKSCSHLQRHKSSPGVFSSSQQREKEITTVLPIRSISTTAAREYNYFVLFLCAMQNLYR